MGMTRNLFKKIRDTEGSFRARMGTIKDRNGMDLAEAEDIKMRWLEYIEELYKNGLKDLDNCDGVVTHLEPDILECNVKWVLESITTAKLVGIMEFQQKYLKSKTIMLLKCCTQYVSKFGKLSSGHRTGKWSVFIPISKKGNAKGCSNYRTIAFLSHASNCYCCC